jgi:endonuclease-3
MKNSAAFERKFKSLLTRIRKVYPAPQLTRPQADPTEEMVWATLLEDSTEGTAKVAMSRLTGQFVDFNELRVSQQEEIVEVLPGTLSEASARADRMIDNLQAIFDREDTLDLSRLRDASKREARQFISSLPGMTPFVEGRVCLFALGIHAMPVDRTLVELLKAQAVVHPQTDPKDTQGFLERVVPARESAAVAGLLEAFRQDPDRLGGAGKSARRKRS